MFNEDFQTESIRLMREADALPDIHGPVDYFDMMQWIACANHYPESEYKPWITRSWEVARKRADESYDRFRTIWLQDCDPSYNVNHNYDPPLSMYDCSRTIDKIDGDWSEDHNCPKYKGQVRNSVTLASPA